MKEMGGGSAVPILQKYIPVQVLNDKGRLKEIVFLEKAGNYELG